MAPVDDAGDAAGVTGEPTSHSGAPTSPGKPKRVRKPLTDEQKARKAQRRRERDAVRKMQQQPADAIHSGAPTTCDDTANAAKTVMSDQQAIAAQKSTDSNKPTTRHSLAATQAPLPKPQEPREMQAPPTPALSSPEFSAMPSFITEDPLSEDNDSSSDEDCWGRPKPPRPTIYDSHGLPRPRPSYYFDADYDAATSGKKKLGRRGGLKGIPVFEPTMEDFAAQGGFYGYVKRIEKYGMRSGVVKVIPPKEWAEHLPSTEGPLREIRLREAIEQHMMGSQGLYRVTNVAKSRIWNPAQWKEMSVSPRWAAPNFKEEREKTDRTDRTPVIGKRARKTEEVEGDQGDDEADAPVKKPIRGTVRIGRGGMRALGSSRDRDGGAADGEEPMQQASPPETVIDPLDHKQSKKAEDETPARSTRSKSAAATTSNDGRKAGSALNSRRGSVADLTPRGKGGKKDGKARAGTPIGGKQSASREDKDSPAPKRVSNLQRAEPTEEEWAAFVKHFEDMPHGMTKEDYSVEMLRDIERRYWRTLTFGEPPMYGADMAGSLFDNKTEHWNVAKLGDLLPKLMPKGCAIPGVVSPYLYFGMWRATFAWHVEDADLYSINYIHFGAPKFWYSVPQEQAERFERVMEGFFPTDRTKCSQFLRHKAFLASPRVLANSGITLNRVVQMPGEFILTYPKGYHSGFNLGFNCAESINFATERWLPLGKTAKACTCISDSVTINVDRWLTEAAKAEALARGDAWPPQHVLAPPTPPRQSSALPRSPPLVPMTLSGQKRAAAPQDDTAVPKRKKSAKLVESESMSFTNSEQAKKTKKAKNATDASSVVYGSSSLLPALPVAGPSGTSGKSSVPLAKKKDFVCALCPSDSNEGLVKIGEPGIKSKKELWAHRLCVMFTPATWIELDPETEHEIVRGFGSIEKARWKLKCSACIEMHGTKVQCTKGKCTRAIHATCALKEDSGFHLDARIGSADKNVSLIESNGFQASPRKHVVPSSPVRNTVEPGVEQQPSDGAAADDVVHLTVLCRTHNPHWKQQEAQRRQAELSARVNALKVGDRVCVRLPGGMFDVKFVRSLPEQESIVAKYDDGSEFRPKWKNIVWPDAKPDLSRRTSATASLGKTESMYVYSGPKVQPSKKRSAGPPGQMVPAYPVDLPFGAPASAPQSSSGFPQHQMTQPCASGLPPPQRSPVVHSQHTIAQPHQPMRLADQRQHPSSYMHQLAPMALSPRVHPSHSSPSAPHVPLYDGPQRAYYPTSAPRPPPHQAAYPMYSPLPPAPLQMSGSPQPWTHVPHHRSPVPPPPQQLPYGHYPPPMHAPHLAYDPRTQYAYPPPPVQHQPVPAHYPPPPHTGAYDMYHQAPVRHSQPREGHRSPPMPSVLHPAMNASAPLYR
ncbi:hypothetical protein OIV83_003988 [Microbotryomycetes sp. JL201]|nr:hypothetical protein OIV83_003988 [Microbotryomycetes sp. JL201]